MPCDAAEEEFVGRFRRSVTIQSKKQLIEPLQYDEKGVAFSTGQGNAPVEREHPPPPRPPAEDWEIAGCLFALALWCSFCLFIFAAAMLDFRILRFC